LHPSRQITQAEIEAQIIPKIEAWKAEARDRQLRASRDVPAHKLDAWLQYTKWHEVLEQSQHDLVGTAQFAEPPTDEPKLERVVRAWGRVLNRCLDTLAATDQKDLLKWWNSPKNEAANQFPFELPQNTRTLERYSGYWECLLCYILRTVPTNWDDETGT